MRFFLFIYYAELNLKIERFFIGAKLVSFKLLGDETRILFLMDNEMIESGELIQQGYNIEVMSACKMRIYGRGKNALVSC